MLFKASIVTLLFFLIIEAYERFKKRMIRKKACKELGILPRFEKRYEDVIDEYIEKRFKK